MRIFIYLISLILVLLLGFSAQAGGTGGHVYLNWLTDQLERWNSYCVALIDDDRARKHSVYISINEDRPDESCFCCCTGATWLCTSNQCEKSNEKCSNKR